MRMLYSDVRRKIETASSTSVTKRKVTAFARSLSSKVMREVVDLVKEVPSAPSAASSFS